MINFILVSHGQMAKGVMDAVELISGKHKGIQIIDLRESDSIEILGQRINQAVQDLQPGSDGIVILVDLFGASPFNQASLVASQHEDVEVITGFNMPMLLEILMQRDSLPLAEIASLARQSGTDGIKVLSDLVK